MIGTQVACINPGGTECPFRDALRVATRLTVAGNRLELFDAAGTRLAVFAAASRGAGHRIIEGTRADVVPMAYAPLPGGEVPPRTFTPDLPQPRQRPAWLAAAGAAMHFSSTASLDVRISEMFRAICAANATRVERLAEQV